MRKLTTSRLLFVVAIVGCVASLIRATANGVFLKPDWTFYLASGLTDTPRMVGTPVELFWMDLSFESAAANAGGIVSGQIPPLAPALYVIGPLFGAPSFGSAQILTLAVAVASLIALAMLARSSLDSVTAAVLVPVAALAPAQAALVGEDSLLTVLVTVGSDGLFALIAWGALAIVLFRPTEPARWTPVLIALSILAPWARWNAVLLLIPYVVVALRWPSRRVVVIRAGASLVASTAALVIFQTATAVDGAAKGLSGSTRPVLEFMLGTVGSWFGASRPAVGALVLGMTLVPLFVKAARRVLINAVDVLRVLAVATLLLHWVATRFFDPNLGMSTRHLVLVFPAVILTAAGLAREILRRLDPGSAVLTVILFSTIVVLSSSAWISAGRTHGSIREHSVRPADSVAMRNLVAPAATVIAIDTETAFMATRKAVLLPPRRQTGSEALRSDDANTLIDLLCEGAMWLDDGNVFVGDKYLSPTEIAGTVPVVERGVAEGVTVFEIDPSFTALLC